jgi:hypothetical protein
VDRLRALNQAVAERAAEEMEDYYQSLVPYAATNPSGTRDVLILAAVATVTKWGNVAGTIAADFYDQSRALAGVGGNYRAEVQAINTSAVEGTTRRLAGSLWTDTPEAALPGLRESAAHFAVQASDATMAQAAIRDPQKVRVARVPGSLAPCEYCVMLASRGFIYYSTDTAAAATAKHHACYCTFVPSWDTSNPHLDGYDPKELKDRWESGAAEEAYKSSAKERTVARISAFVPGTVKVESTHLAVLDPEKIKDYSLGNTDGTTNWDDVDRAIRDGVIENPFAQLPRLPGKEYDSLKRWQQDERLDDLRLSTNPHFGEGLVKAGDTDAYKINCQRVVHAYELRVRGFDVTAAPNGPQRTYPSTAEMWIKKDGSHPEFEPAHTEKLRQGLSDKWGDGSRHITYVDWGSGFSAHVFNSSSEATVHGNTSLWIREAQTMRQDVTGNYWRTEGLQRMMRVDDCEPSARMLLDPVYGVNGTHPILMIVSAHEQAIL